MKKILFVCLIVFLPACSSFRGSRDCPSPQTEEGFQFWRQHSAAVSQARQEGWTAADLCRSEGAAGAYYFTDSGSFCRCPVR